MSPTLLITGANRGIGLEFVRQYAADGWRVFACCRNLKKAVELETLAKDSGGRITVHTLDVEDFSQIERLADELAGQNIDVLINNAGIYPDSTSGGFGATNYEGWARAFRINTMAPLKMAETFAGNVARGQQKKIVNITSKMGSISDNTSGGAYIYRSSKTALNMVIKSLSHDLAPRGIATAVLHPGWVLTDMGGPNALITTEQSVTGMRQVIARLSMKDSGKFYAYDGQEIPW
jgi:NAD(P)-dependent dehydrogenase (short-subunit alcohol dehydrogenase family)